ncbi:MAG: double zinc ribbon domain-containing protein [bacterium JZ-2024 1]
MGFQEAIQGFAEKVSPLRLNNRAGVEDWWVRFPGVARSLEVARDGLFVFPRCISCQRGSLHALCDECRSRVFRRLNSCSRCGFILSRGDMCGDCLTRKRPFERLEFLGYYEKPFSGTLQAFKFQRRPGLASHLAKATLSVPRIAEFVDQCDSVTYVPCSPVRLRVRGYNQSLLLAREIAWRSRKPLVHALKKVRETPPQVGLNYANRIKNLEGAFQIALQMRHPIHHKRLLLIDDIYTTGATVEACAKPLVRAGVSAVFVLVLARVRNATS